MERRHVIRIVWVERDPQQRRRPAPSRRRTPSTRRRTRLARRGLVQDCRVLQ